MIPEEDRKNSLYTYSYKHTELLQWGWCDLIDASCNRVRDYTRILVQQMDIFFDEAIQIRVGIGTSVVRFIQESSQGGC